MSNPKVFSIFSLFFFLITFASSTSFNTSRRCPKEQSEALLLFKHSLYKADDQQYDCLDWLGSDYHPIMINWKTSRDCCNWNGVTCDHSTGDVIGIDLGCGMLSGTIHPNTSLFNLPRLKKLNLAYNSFYESQLPGEVGRFSKSLTHLNLSNSGFSGQVPTDITLLSKLVSLDLSDNQFDLKIRVLNNMFHNYTNLEELSLRFVNISSVLPTSLNISSSLKLLNLYQTQLQGKLPHYIFNLPSLKTLHLGNNYFTGDIPSEISLLPKLVNLNIGFSDLRIEPHTFHSLLKNSTLLKSLDLSGCSLMGSLPKSLFNLRHLTYLYLTDNKLNGTLPSRLFTLPSLVCLYLDGNMFSGNVQFESFSLSSLQELDLSFNNFSGEWELDTMLSSLTDLYFLELSYSGFSVTSNNANHYVNPGFEYLGMASCKLKGFPNSVRAMQQLKFLDLSSNEIHGIPHWADEIGGIKLHDLNLSHNFITALQPFQWYGLQTLYLQSNLIQEPFPPSICNMSHLRYLDMSNNRFHGLIPQCFGEITSSLEMIDMGNNSFQGTIPSLYYDCEWLTALILKGNQLEGDVPSSLSKCIYLSVLDLGNNRLNGTFPGWLGDLPNLQVLVLKSNKFHGHIQPSSTVEFPFTSLQVMDLSHNGFVGKLPAKYFQSFNSMKNVVKSSRKLEYLDMGAKYYSFKVVMKGVDQDIPRLFVNLNIIDLSNNHFEREIPEIIGNLSSLKVLNLSHNSLNGRIPNTLGKLAEIESLDLSWNQLAGNIPQSLAGIKRLAVLNLSQNHLVGRIPEGTQFSTFQENSYSGNFGLCGFPLPKKCSEYTHKPQLESHKRHEEESGFTWEVVTLGYGCGTILGLVMGYIMLSTRKVKCFNVIADAGEHMILERNKRRYVFIGK